MFKIQNTILLVVDIQGKLADSMHEKELLFRNAQKLIKGIQVVTDAVSSRRLTDKEIGLQKMRDSGASWTSVETALFEMLKVAEGEAFRKVLRIVK